MFEVGNMIVFLVLVFGVVFWGDFFSLSSVSESPLSLPSLEIDGNVHCFCVFLFIFHCC